MIKIVQFVQMTEKERIQKTFAIAAELFKPRIDPTKIEALYARWNFPKSVIQQVFNYFESDLEACDTYLDIMDAITESDDPIEAWESWCIHSGAEHEIDNNPFHA